MNISAYRIHRSVLTAAILLGMTAACLFSSARAQSGGTSASTVDEGLPPEDDAAAPIDRGVRSNAVIQSDAATAGPASIPAGAANANRTGFFGPALAWPIIPIHAILLPDGRVMSYGTDSSGNQGAILIYDIWDPAVPDAASHLVLPNVTKTDIFCGAQSLIGSGSLTGQVLMSGGDATIGKDRNYSTNATTLFTPQANKISSLKPMQYSRWYASLVALPSGNLVVFGGHNKPTAPKQNIPGAETPELFTAATGWTSLTKATSVDAFGGSGWSYPRAYVAPGGNVFVLAASGKMFSVDVANQLVTQYPTVTAPSKASLPSIPYAPGKLLSLRNDRVVTVDYTGKTPVVKTVANIDQLRYWSNGAVMADGKVLVTGGGSTENGHGGDAFTAQIWDPKTEKWTTGALAAKRRLYHSISLLLPDATVLTGGGGAPGIVKNLNAEIYYPPYLYDASGQPAVRPVFTLMTPTVHPNGFVQGNVGAKDQISRITMLRTGSVTHSYNSDQRFLDVPFTQNGQHIVAHLSSDPGISLQGYYMLFAFNQAGVPSVAKMVRIAP